MYHQPRIKLNFPDEMPIEKENEVVQDGRGSVWGGRCTFFETKDVVRREKRLKKFILIISIIIFLTVIQK